MAGRKTTRRKGKRARGKDRDFPKKLPAKMSVRHLREENRTLKRKVAKLSREIEKLGGLADMMDDVEQKQSPAVAETKEVGLRCATCGAKKMSVFKLPSKSIYCCHICKAKVVYPNP